MENKKIFLTAVLFLAVLLMASCSFNKEKEEDEKKSEIQKEEPKQEYVILSKKGEKFTFPEGFMMEFSELKNYVDVVSAFDIEEGVYSIIYQGKHETAAIKSGKVYMPYSEEILGAYELEGDVLKVDAKAFLEYFDGEVLTKEEYDKKNNKTKTDDLNTKESDDEKNTTTEDNNIDKNKTEDKKTEIPNNEGNKNVKKSIMVWDPEGTDDSIVFDPSIDVVIPRWLALKEPNGDFNKYVNEDYAKNVRRQGKDLWVLVTNSFDPDLTSEVLNSYAARMNMVEYLYNYAQTFGLDGIDIDFENIHLKDKDLFVQFIAELGNRLKKSNIKLGVCVTVPGGSDNWSKVFDRQRLVEHVDYLHLMAYDQHWASSQTSGPVASYDWVEGHLDGLIESGIPPEKIILGLPLYTRVWYESYSDTEPNKVIVESRSLYMSGAERVIRENPNAKKVWDEVAGQYFYVYIDSKENEIVKLWHEDTKSIAKKAGLVKEKGLSGMACWALGFEEPDLWGELKKLK